MLEDKNNSVSTAVSAASWLHWLNSIAKNQVEKDLYSHSLRSLGTPVEKSGSRMSKSSLNTTRLDCELLKDLQLCLASQWVLRFKGGGIKRC